MISPGIFRQYDIRGVVGDDLTVEAAEAIGRAYGALLAERGITPAVAVGRDNRPSGTALRDALVRGLRAIAALRQPARWIWSSLIWAPSGRVS